MKESGNSLGYIYPHDSQGGWVNQHYLPSELKGTIFYEPTDRGIDAQIGEKLDRLRKLRDKS
jgi:putative ATPase